MTTVKLKDEPIIEAFQYTGRDTEEGIEVHSWIRKNGGIIQTWGALCVWHGKGWLHVNEGDWIIHYGSGVFAVMAPEMFHEKFERV